MEKDWKECTCDECDFCVKRRCRKRPHTETLGPFPVVSGKDACSEFKLLKK